MRHAATTLLLASLALGMAGAALAQGKVPITQDLARSEETNARLGRDPTGAREAPYGRPGVSLSGPSGVVGFDGPPNAIYGDSVSNVGPYPPGAPGNFQ